MTALRVLIMACVFLPAAIRTGMVGPNRTAIENEYQLSHLHFGISPCFLLSSLIALYHLPASLVFGPAVLRFFRA